jgi:hypothetical protein
MSDGSHNYHNICNNITNNSNLEEEIDFLQLQINEIHNKYKQICDKNSSQNVRYNQLLGEIDTMHFIMGCLTDNVNTCSCSDTKSCCSKIYKDTTIEHIFIPPKDISIIFITLVGGGGAGGIGHTSGFEYLSGGGGGGGSTILKMPICMKPDIIFKIHIGKGGCSTTGMNGEDTVVEIVCDNEIIKLVANGGMNGFPSINLGNDVSGGKGGINCENDVLSGQDGKPGSISNPSQFPPTGGNGGCSLFYKGGKGGGTFFNGGGNGGNDINMIGENGSYGSGGGGSVPQINIDINVQLSGKGGDGYVIFEWS